MEKILHKIHLETKVILLIDLFTWLFLWVFSKFVSSINFQKIYIAVSSHFDQLESPDCLKLFILTAIFQKLNILIKQLGGGGGQCGAWHDEQMWKYWTYKRMREKVFAPVVLAQGWPTFHVHDAALRSSDPVHDSSCR